ncbi:hypothetical protein EIM50_20305 [Pseudoxanthomonas sp. SGD-10]|nr:hypothetical protein EIM50_20305 [Pseudoxanthomonas sp. SGD-10]
MKILCLLSVLSVALLSAACESRKYKDKWHMQELNAVQMHSRKQDKQVEETELRHEDKENLETRIELIAEDVFYWHPDSGIVSRFAPLQMKIQSSLLQQHYTEQRQALQRLQVKDSLSSYHKNTLQKKQTQLLEREAFGNLAIWLKVFIILTFLLVCYKVYKVF